MDDRELLRLLMIIKIKMPQVYRYLLSLIKSLAM